MNFGIGTGGHLFRPVVAVRKSAWTAAFMTVGLHLFALFALISVGGHRLHHAHADVRVVSMSLISAAAQKHDLGMFPTDSSAATSLSGKKGAQSDELAEAIAQRREPVSLPAFDPYFPPEELHSHPQPISEIVLDDDCLQTGTTALKLWISETGHVDRIDIVSSAAGEPCVERAKQAFSRSIFAPGMRDGSPVKSLWFVEIWHPAAPT